MSDGRIRIGIDQMGALSFGEVESQTEGDGGLASSALGRVDAKDGCNRVVL